MNIKEEQKAFQDELFRPSVVISLEHADVLNNLFNFSVELQEPDVSAFIKKNIDKFAKETTEETNKQIAKTLEDGINNGDSIPDLKKRIHEVFNVATNSRAEMIARTEVTRSSTWVNEQIYKQAGITQKEWFVNPGACQYCQPLNGKIVNINQLFFEKYTVAQGDNGGSIPLTYENIARPPLHPNCRCDILPVII